MGTVYGYVRVSTTEQRLGGYSIEAQSEAIKARYEQRFRAAGEEWGGIPKEMAVSAKIPFGRRRAGKWLMRNVKTGDTVIISRLDRAFRNTRDFLAVAEAWLEKGVNLHVIQLNFDFGSGAIAKFICTIMAATAELERGFISERTKIALAVRREKGEHVGQTPWGFKLANRQVKGKKKKVLVPDWAARRYGALLISLRGQGMTWDKIHSVFKENDLRYHNRVPGRMTLHRWWGWEIQLRQKEEAEGRPLSEADRLATFKPEFIDTYQPYTYEPDKVLENILSHRAAREAARQSDARAL